MPRSPKLRANYRADAQYFLRLIKAIERDFARPKEWRQGVIAKLQSLTTDMLNAPEDGHVETPVEESHRDSQVSDESETHANGKRRHRTH